MTEETRPYPARPNGHGDAVARTPDRSTPAAPVVESCDQLVRQLLHAGLQLHQLRVVFDRAGSDAHQLRAAGAAVAVVLDELDVLIHAAGLAVFAGSAHLPRETGV